MKITEEWLTEFCTDRGGWTAAQLKIIGVAWPPTHGWKRTVIGNEISESDAAEFERARFALTKRTLKNYRKRGIAPYSDHRP